MMYEFVAQHFKQYLIGQWSRTELENWLVAHLQDILDSGDRRAIEAANAVDSALVELSEQLLDERQFLSTVSRAIRSGDRLVITAGQSAGQTMFQDFNVLSTPRTYHVQHSFSPAEACR